MRASDFLLLLLIPLSIFWADRLGHREALHGPAWVPRVATGYLRVVMWILAGAALALICYALGALLLALARAIVEAYHHDVDPPTVY